MHRSTLFAILAGLGWGIGELFTKSILNSGRMGSFSVLAVRTTIALPFLWFAWWTVSRSIAPEPTGWTRAGSGLWFKLIVGSGLIAGAGAALCFFTALRLGEISRVKPIAFSLAPATAVLLGSIVFQEPLTLRKIVAVGLILTGVILLAGK